MFKEEAGFKDKVFYAAKALYQFLNTTAASKILNFCKPTPCYAWVHILRNLCAELRPCFKQLRESKSPGAYLLILHYFRKQNSVEQERNELVRNHIDDIQPANIAEQDRRCLCQGAVAVENTFVARGTSTCLATG